MTFSQKRGTKLVIPGCYIVKGNKDGSISLWVQDVLSVCIFENVISENSEVSACSPALVLFIFLVYFFQVGMYSVLSLGITAAM